MFLMCLLVVGVIGCCDARPMTAQFGDPTASFGRRGIDSYIIGGTDASSGAWPWQLSLQQLWAGSWYHICGASLLSSTKALTAAHCLDGYTASQLRVVAGLHDRFDSTGVQISGASRIVMHDEYNTQPDLAAYSNDIGILHLQTSITPDANVQFLTLPANDNFDYAGETCTMTGWGRDSTSQGLPDILQQADIQVITTSACSASMQSINDAYIWDRHICLYDTAEHKGSCNGDSGGPLNCPDGQGGYVVAGISSFGVSNSNDECLQEYPSVYTRTSSYLFWIFQN